MVRLVLELQEGIFATSSDEIPNFNLKEKIVTCLLEWNQNILLLKRSAEEGHPNTWCIPGGKCEIGENSKEAIIREVSEETNIRLAKGSVQSVAEFYIRSARCGCDYFLKIFQNTLIDLPTIQLNPAEHIESQWVSKEMFCSFNLLPFQKEIFEYVYENNLI